MRKARMNRIRLLVIVTLMISAAVNRPASGEDAIGQQDSSQSVPGSISGFLKNLSIPKKAAAIKSTIKKIL